MTIYITTPLLYTFPKPTFHCRPTWPLIEGPAHRPDAGTPLAPPFSLIPAGQPSWLMPQQSGVGHLRISPLAYCESPLEDLGFIGGRCPRRGPADE